jgi:hypothetical protein
LQERAGRSGPADAGGAAPPETAAEALARARRHGRAALAEALQAVVALLDAASLASTGVPAEAHRSLSLAAKALAGAASGLAPDADSALAQALAGALDAEIARWEPRADDDPEARAVLRAFLGLRELLWELGVRRTPATAPERGAQRAAEPVRRRPRVERVHVQG